MEEKYEGSCIEVASAIILALASLATAWSAYQATLWSGIQTFRLAASNTTGMAASEKALLAQQRLSVDAMIIVNFANAWVEEKHTLAAFYLKRMRPDLRVAVEAWLATKPLENPEAPPHPLAMPEYVEKVRSSLEAEVAQLRAESQRKLRRRNGPARPRITMYC